MNIINWYPGTLRQRQDVIAQPGEWGEGVDVSAFASIHNIAIMVVVLTFPNRQETETFTYFPVNIAGQ